MDTRDFRFKQRRTYVTGRTPDPSGLLDGELYTQIADGTIYFKNAQGSGLHTVITDASGFGLNKIKFSGANSGDIPYWNGSQFVATGFTSLTGQFISTGQTGQFVTTGQTGQFITTGQTGQFVTTGQTGQFITTGQTGQFVTTGQTGQFITTGQTGDFASKSDIVVKLSSGIKSSATFSNVASGVQSISIGGSANKAIGAYSSVIGGTLGNAQGDYSSVISAPVGTAFGNQSLIIGGYTNIANGAGSVVIGGSYNNTIGSNSYAFGSRAVAHGNGEFAFANGRNNYDGDAQFSLRMGRVNTFDSIPKNAIAGGQVAER